MQHEILTPEQMYAADALATAKGRASLELMEAAGKAVATEIINRFEKCAVAVLCGPGNNGGDGFVVARLLAARQWPVKVYLLGERSKLKGDAGHMAAMWKGAVEDFAAFERNHGGQSAHRLIVDALYGAGLSRDLPVNIADGIRGAERPVIAIDLPSGVDGNTGQVRGAAVIATLTVTFVRKKPGHVLYPGRRLCGEVVVADIGIGSDILDELPIRIFENLKPDLPVLQAETHKFKRGHVLVWSGPALSTGAARLAAQAAARTGSGLTTLAGTKAALTEHAHHVTSIMLKDVERLPDLTELIRQRKITAACIGPAAGVTDETRQAVGHILQSGAETVLDADALTAFADAPSALFEAIKALPDRGVVMTPHEGEFVRIFNDLCNVSDSKVERAIKAAQRSGARVVLKGPDTVIANPDGCAKVNTNAPPKLATAGSGDVLAGIITSLLAQGMDAWNAACAGVWLHGEAANTCPRRIIIAEDLIDHLAM